MSYAEKLTALDLNEAIKLVAQPSTCVIRYKFGTDFKLVTENKIYSLTARQFYYLADSDLFSRYYHDCDTDIDYNRLNKRFPRYMLLGLIAEVDNFLVGAKTKYNLYLPAFSERVVVGSMRVSLHLLDKYFPVTFGSSFTINRLFLREYAANKPEDNSLSQTEIKRRIYELNT